MLSFWLLVLLSLRHVVQVMTLSLCSIQRARAETRKAIADDFRAKFNLEGLLTIHWSAKLLPNITAYDEADRLAVIFTGIDYNIIFWCSWTVERNRQSSSWCIFFCAWVTTVVSDQVTGFYFDTKSNNTGNFNGSCITSCWGTIHLEKKLVQLIC